MESINEPAGMELRSYLAVLRRRRVLIVLVTVAVAAFAGISSSLKPAMYSASAKVLMQVGDPSEQINQTAAAARLSGGDSDRYIAAQLDVIRGKTVATAVAPEIKGSTVDGLLRQITVSQVAATDIIVISATDRDPERAAAVANAFARAYIENRRLEAVSGLERASAEIGTKLHELEAQLASLDAQIAKANQKAAAAPKGAHPADGQADDSQADPALLAARNASAIQYQSLYSQQQTLLVNKSLKKGEADLLTAAEAPGGPFSPRPKRSLMLGSIVGLLLGLGLAFLREQLDDRVHSREQVAQITKLPVLGEIPLDADSAKHPTEVGAARHRSSNLAEATRSLRTGLTFLGIDQPNRRILITSAEPREGKSFLASNLAAVYAQAGLKTVLVSADLRRPRIDSMFPEATAGPGLTGLIAGLAATHGTWSDSGPSSDITRALYPTRIENLFLLPSGKLPPNPAEILGSRWTDEVLDALSVAADVIVIDAPPSLVVTDAVLLAGRVDSVLIVAAARETHRGALARAAAALSTSQARVLGVVLNKVDSANGSYYGYGTYSALPAKKPRGLRRHQPEVMPEMSDLEPDRVEANRP